MDEPTSRATYKLQACLIQGLGKEIAVNLAEHIVAFGTKAVLELRQMPGLKAETSIPEPSISSHIVSNLKAQLGLDAKAEVSYERILRSFDVEGSDLVGKFGGLRADIAIFDGKQPSGIVEIKIVDEGRGLGGVNRDWEKTRSLQGYMKARGVPALPCYVGALVCDLENRTTDMAIEALAQQLGLNPSAIEVDVGQKALSLAWSWVFVCATVQD